MQSIKRQFAFLALACAAAAAQADGVSDLRAALARYAAQAPLRATLEVKTFDRHGEGKDAEDKSGQASVLIDDGPRGLQVTYAKDMLALVDGESRRQARDPKAKTPTLWALERLDASEYAPMVSAASRLALRLEDAIPKGEKAEDWQGKPARRLSFAIPDTHLSESERKYVKNFEASIDVWIAADGTPLASAERAEVSGRAFVVVSFESKQEDSATYAVVGDRLVALRRESHNVSSGAGEKGEQRVVKTLQLLP